MPNLFAPKPAPPAFGQGKVVPIQRASIFSRLFLFWLDPLLSVGYSRPLEKEDLWSLPDVRHTDALTKRIEETFYARCPPDERPKLFYDDNGLKSRTTGEADQAVDKDDTGKSKSMEDASKSKSTEDAGKSKLTEDGAHPKPDDKGQYDRSLTKAIHSVFFVELWTAGVFKLLSDTLNTTTPLVNQLLLAWLTSSYIFARTSDEERTAFGLQKPQGIGYGIGLAFAVFAMQQVSSLLASHYMMKAMTSGLSLRTSLIGAIFRKSLRLSGRARQEHNVGQVTTMISADTERCEHNAAIIHNVWVAPIQIGIGIGLLIRNLGVSALVGLGVLILGFPIQGILAGQIFKQRLAGVAFTDQRVRLSTEVLSGIRLIKYYAWEGFYAHQISALREKEVGTIRRYAIAQATLLGFVTVTPILATVLSIITYALRGGTLDVAIIFSSVQYFDIIRAPLTFFPIGIAAMTDALVAVRRIATFLRAEELAVPYTVDPSSELALDVDGDFSWEAATKDAAAATSAAPAPAKADKGKKDKADTAVLPTTINAGEGSDAEEPKDAEDEKPFELKDLKFKVQKGSFVAIVGRVGSGKSSLLQALIGEMRKTRGDCVFSSTAAYVPQTPWIMNATLRQNIIFGLDEDEARLREIVRACCLEPDLEMLPNGEQTEIGEKGINLSGGQKARVSLARAAYSGADIVLMDDSLSAVDSHVGKKLLDNCLLRGPLADKTRVLVTHALHVLDKTDYIFVMDEGAIVEQGTYADLITNGEMFSRLVEEYGSMEKHEEELREATGATDVAEKELTDGASPKKAAEALMQEEERATGAVSWSVYKKYFRHAGGSTVLPIIILWVVLSQGTNVANSVFLGFWTSSSISGFTQADYIGVYAGLGVGSGIFSFALSITTSFVTLVAGLKLFKAALLALFRSPVSFFDTTPMGRIISRLSKDQDVLDTMVSLIFTTLLTTMASVVGTAGLVFYTFPYLGIMFIPMTILYYLAANYYRRTSVEVKRLDSVLRSNLYSAYSEALTGLSTLRAYRSQGRFVTKTEAGLDQENRASYMTVVIQAWLSIRLDLLGNLLILGICLFAAGLRTSVNPSKIGVVLSYSLTITQTFSALVSTYAYNEQNFNAVERILHYTELPDEGPTTTPEDPPQSWPEAGAVEFKDVEMSYRPGLPPVLKGVDFQVKAGEKVGIVGRTGAGKSSLLQALFRIVNVKAGTITIDGVDIAKVGLDVLRGRLALVPQDSVLFKGTLRENLDPLKTRSDAELIDCMKRAGLLPKDGTLDPPSTAEGKFSLDSVVTDEGSNYSAGEKQLLALCRALVKNSRIIVLDEATSNVDVETDAKVQRTIQREFSASTLLCIAHRLNTIAYYDRILVMDAGRVAEFDAPLALFDKEDSIFRSLCNEANLSRQDIVRIRASVETEQYAEVA